MADAFLQQLVTCFFATVSSKVSTLIGSKLAFKSLHSTLPENPDVGFKSEVILFTCNNHHVTKYSCFHLAQSRLNLVSIHVYYQFTRHLFEHTPIDANVLDKIRQ